MVEYISELGATSLTVSRSAAVVDPPEFVAVMVNVAGAAISVGVPLITPVVVLKFKPDGNEGEIE